MPTLCGYEETHRTAGRAGAGAGAGHRARPRQAKAKVYKGTFKFVGADGDYVTGNFGKAQLVDGKRNDKLSVHVRRLAAKTKYMFRLQQGVCKQGAAGGTDVAGCKYHSR